MADPRPTLRLRTLQHHLTAGGGGGAPLASAPCRAADNAAVPDASKLCTAEEAVARIPPGVWLTPAGFVGTSCPELLLNALRCGGGGRRRRGVCMAQATPQFDPLPRRCAAHAGNGLMPPAPPAVLASSLRPPSATAEAAGVGREGWRAAVVIARAGS